MTDTLDRCRTEIDAIDDALIDLLSTRFRVVDRVIAIKTREQLPAVIPSRVEEVVNRVRARASAKSVPTDLAEALWRQLIAGTVTYERQNNVKP